MMRILDRKIFADILSDVVRIPFSKSYLLPSGARSSKCMDAGPLMRYLIAVTQFDRRGQSGLEY